MDQNTNYMHCIVRSISERERLQIKKKKKTLGKPVKQQEPLNRCGN